MVDPCPDRHSARRRGVDRRPSARPGEADRGSGKAADDPGSVARLEMAVHLSGPNHRDGQYAHRSRRRTAAIPAHLGKRDERVLHPAIGQHDLHDERHDHPAQSAGRRAGHVRGTLVAFQRRWIFGHAFRCPCRCARAILEVGAGQREDSPAARRGELWRNSPGPRRTTRTATYRLADPDLFQSVVTQKLPPSPGAQSGVKGASPAAGVADAR